MKNDNKPKNKVSLSDEQKKRLSKLGIIINETPDGKSIKRVKSGMNKRSQNLVVK